jgi:F-type H+-transporting ATPase subunit delta
MDKNVILAKKYGRAIYEIASEQHSLEQTEKDLTLIEEALEQNAEFNKFMNHPLLSKAMKKDTLKKLFADKVQPIVLQFCYVVLDKDRFGDFAGMVDVYKTFAHEGLGVEEAVVTTALPLSKEQAKEFKDTLSKMTDKKIILKQKVDTALIGGFTVQIGDRLIDGSVARQLETLKAKIMQ